MNRLFLLVFIFGFISTECFSGNRLVLDDAHSIKAISHPRRDPLPIGYKFHALTSCFQLQAKTAGPNDVGQIVTAWAAIAEEERAAATEQKAQEDRRLEEIAVRIEASRQEEEREFMAFIRGALTSHDTRANPYQVASASKGNRAGAPQAKASAHHSIASARSPEAEVFYQLEASAPQSAAKSHATSMEEEGDENIAPAHETHESVHPVSSAKKSPASAGAAAATEEMRSPFRPLPQNAQSKGSSKKSPAQSASRFLAPAAADAKTAPHSGIGKKRDRTEFDDISLHSRSAREHLEPHPEEDHPSQGCAAGAGSESGSDSGPETKSLDEHIERSSRSSSSASDDTDSYYEESEEYAEISYIAEGAAHPGAEDTDDRADSDDDIENIAPLSPAVSPERKEVFKRMRTFAASKIAEARAALAPILKPAKADLALLSAGERALAASQLSLIKTKLQPLKNKLVSMKLFDAPQEHLIKAMNSLHLEAASLARQVLHIAAERKAANIVFNGFAQTIDHMIQGHQSRDSILEYIETCGYHNLIALKGYRASRNQYPHIAIDYSNTQNTAREMLQENIASLRQLHDGLTAADIYALQPIWRTHTDKPHFGWTNMAHYGELFKDHASCEMCTAICSEDYHMLTHPLLAGATVACPHCADHMTTSTEMADTMLSAAEEEAKTHTDILSALK